MFFCYAGLMMIAIIFWLCLWESFKQWRKAEQFQKDGTEAGTEAGDQRVFHHLETLERNSRDYATAYLIAAAIAALIEILAGGLIWTFGG